MNRSERNIVFGVAFVGFAAFAVFAWGAWLAKMQGDESTFSFGVFALIDQNAPLLTGSSVTASDVMFFSSLLGTAAAGLTIVSWMLGAKPRVPHK